MCVMQLSQIGFIIHYPNNFVNVRMYITKITQFISLTLIRCRESHITYTLLDLMYSHYILYCTM